MTSQIVSDSGLQPSPVGSPVAAGDPGGGAVGATPPRDHALTAPQASRPECRA